METLTTIDNMRGWTHAQREEGKRVGFVPTMGYLHEGHLSLMRRACAENDVCVTSIFVNPTQFGPNEDFESYPRDPESDAAKCREVGVEVIFMPEANEVYGPGAQTTVNVTHVSLPLCGASRPGHFQGVATVVLKLFNIVLPHTAYFGAKDYQQFQVIKTMVRDLNLEVDVIPCEIVREKDGLAMSSRNYYLAPNERKQAVCLYQALQEAKRRFDEGETVAENYLAGMRERIDREPDAVVDYISLVHPETLEDLERVDGRALAALAVRIGKTRLIDNLLMEG